MERMNCMKTNEYLCALRSALIGLGAGIAVLLIGALAAVRMANPAPMLSAIAYTALALGGAVSGFLQGRTGAGLPMLGLAAGIYGGFLFLVSLILGGFSRLWLRGAVYLLMALIAVLVGWLTPSPRPKRKYRYK